MNDNIYFSVDRSGSVTVYNERLGQHLNLGHVCISDIVESFDQMDNEVVLDSAFHYLNAEQREFIREANSDCPLVR